MGFNQAQYCLDSPECSNLVEKDLITPRDEKSVYVQARKCKCNSVWCESYGCLKPWIERTTTDLRDFDWKRTRQIVLTVDPGQFQDGEEAYNYVKDNKLLSQFIRNLERGKKSKIGKKWVQKYRPVKIMKYMWFLEWHKNEFPHWHLFIETEEYGRFSRIGADVIRYYWSWGRIGESFFKSQKHWDYQTGHFQKNGYFHKDKKHQTRLPAWALDRPGIKIRRSCHSRRGEGNGKGRIEDEPDIDEGLLIDRLTGEILEPGSMTYRERLALCGTRTSLKIYMADKEIDGVFDIPYQNVKENYQGHYRDRAGYGFRVSTKEAEQLLTKMIKGKEIGYLKKRYSEGREIIKHWCPICGDWTYQKIREVRDHTDVYLCLRCKTIHEYREREHENWRNVGLEG